jgi:HD-GYP domain-containing protein (c-di-GMP phosphodiesterase class II)
MPMNDGVRLADLLSGLSFVSDMGLGLPPEDALRCCLVGTALARKLNLSETEVADVFYTSLLQHIGCTGYAHESYLVWGDDIAANRAAQRTDFTHITDIYTTYLLTLTKGKGMLPRARMVAILTTKGPGFLKRFTTATCEVAAQTARRLNLPEGVQRGLYEVFEWWNGRSAPRGLKGEEISLIGRVTHVAGVGAKFDLLGGPDLAVDTVKQRAGTVFDPAISEVFVTNAPELLAAANIGDPRERVLEAEPEPVSTVSEPQLVEVAAAFGDIADLKNPFTHGHSGGVAQLALQAGKKVGLKDAILLQLHVASLLHDLGRVGIPNSVWEKRTKLTAADWEQIRLHPYHSERILSCSSILLPMAAIAGMHHERMDGSGYLRGFEAAHIPMTARILAAADALQAMTQSRPHRAALDVDYAAERLQDDAAAGRFDPDAVAAVVIAAGGSSKRTIIRPAGLSDREIEVLRLVCQGLSNREVARRLYISPRTAEHHVQHIYTKIGVSSRAAAALYGMQHGLVT